MNTNDFYKQLFEKYALDEEKIRKNAIKAAKTPAWQRTLGAHWKTAVGAAAAVAVTVGAVAYTAANPPGINNITTSQNMPTAYQRLRDAEQIYYNISTEDESKADIYVSFMDVMSYNDIAVAFSALHEYEDIDIACLYLKNGSRISGTENVAAYAVSEGNTKNILGAKVCAPAKCFKDIWDLSCVYLPELGSEELNDDTFHPIEYDDRDPLADSEFITTTAQQPSFTTTAFSFVKETTAVSKESAESVSGAVISETADETTVPVPDEITVPMDDVTDDTEDADTTSVPEESRDSDTSEEPAESEDPEETEQDERFGDEPELTEETEDADTTDVFEYEEEEVTDEDDDEGGIIYSEADEGEYTDTAAESTVPVTEITDSAAVGLMTQIYQLNVENAVETVLAGNYAIVLTRSEAYFYTLGGLISSQPKVCEIGSPKIAYHDDRTVILTGCDSDGLRSVIVTLDMMNDCVYSSRAGVTLGEAEIATIHYSPVENKYFLKAFSASTTYFYEFTVTADAGIVFRPLLEYSGAVSAAGYLHSTLYFAAANDDLNYDLYAFNCLNGELEKAASFGQVCKVRRSRTFESFIVTASDTESGDTASYVFDPVTSKLVKVVLGSEPRISSANGTVYVNDNGVDYLYSNGKLNMIDTPVRYSYEFSSDYTIVSTDSEKVVIAENKWN